MPSESISSTQYRILVLNDAYVKEKRREIQTHVCHTSIRHTQLTASRKEPSLQAVACTSRGCWWRAARAAGRTTWRPRSCTRWRGSPSIPSACQRSSRTHQPGQDDPHHTPLLCHWQHRAACAGGASFRLWRVAARAGCAAWRLHPAALRSHYTDGLKRHQCMSCWMPDRLSLHLCVCPTCG